MTRVEFLEEAKGLFPEAKKVLLTAYADTEAAIRAINDVGLDHYLQKPWDPPEEKFYPVLDDQLKKWLSGFKPPFEGIRVVGKRCESRDSHRFEDFLTHRIVTRRHGGDMRVDSKLGETRFSVRLLVKSIEQDGG